MSRWDIRTSMMKAFKPGERVRCIDNAHHSSLLAIGDEGTVADPPYEDGYVMLKIDGDRVTRGWNESRWERAGGSLMPDTREYLETVAS